MQETRRPPDTSLKCLFFVPQWIKSTFSQFPELSLHAVATFHAIDAAKLVFFADRWEEREREKNWVLTRMEKSNGVPAVTDWSWRMVAVVGERERETSRRFKLTEQKELVRNLATFHQWPLQRHQTQFNTFRAGLTLHRPLITVRPSLVGSLQHLHSLWWEVWSLFSEVSDQFGSFS